MRKEDRGYLWTGEVMYLILLRPLVKKLYLYIPAVVFFLRNKSRDLQSQV